MNFKSFNSTLSLLEELIGYCQVSNKSISAWSIGEHIEHTLKVDEEIFKLVLHCQESLIQRDSSISFLGKIVLLFKFIPKGKGKAPPHTQPTGINGESMSMKVTEVRKLLEQIIAKQEEIKKDKRNFGRHPYFGAMTRLQWLLFASVHQNHHVKIIQSIMKEAEFSQQTGK